MWASTEEFVAVCYRLLAELAMELMEGNMTYCILTLFAESVEICAVV